MIFTWENWQSTEKKSNKKGKRFKIPHLREVRDNFWACNVPQEVGKSDAFLFLYLLQLAPYAFSFFPTVTKK